MDPAPVPGKQTDVPSLASRCAEATLCLSALTISLAVASVASGDPLGLAFVLAEENRPIGAALICGVAVVGGLASRSFGAWGVCLGVAAMLIGTLLAPLDYAVGPGLHPLETGRFYGVYALASGVACALVWQRGPGPTRGLAGWTASRTAAWGALAFGFDCPFLGGFLVVMDGLGAFAIFRGAASRKQTRVWLPIVLAGILAQPDLAALFTHDHRAAGVTLDSLGVREDRGGPEHPLPAGLGLVRHGGRVEGLAEGAPITHVALAAEATRDDLREAARHLPSLRALVIIVTVPSAGWVQARVESAESRARTARIVPLVRQGERPGFLDPTGQPARCATLDGLPDGPVAPGPSVFCIDGLPAFESEALLVHRARLTPRYWPAMPAPTLVMLLLSALAVAFKVRQPSGP